MIKVLVCGAGGKMGKEVVKAVNKEDDLQLVAAVDIKEVGKDIGEIVGISKKEVIITKDLKHAITEMKPEVMVDFTHPEEVLENIRIATKYGLQCVIGTTGFDETKIQEVESLTKEYNTAAIIAPNFAIGAVLLMKFAKDAARYFSAVEIIELHHNQKVDAPSGTAIKTAEMIAEVRGQRLEVRGQEIEKIKKVRGGELSGIRIHSVRLPGLVAHQEVIFGGQGQTLTLRHDSLSRESFMPGVIMAIRKVKEIKGVIYGLENLL